MKETLTVLPTGTIDIVHTIQGAVIQFNCSCVDALPYCKGMCCSMKHMYNVNLSETEAMSGKFSVMELSTRPDEYFLAYDPETKRCVHHDDDSLCTVHEYKPRNCANWHCSPDGKGEGITRTGGGWFLLPVLVEEHVVLPLPEKL